MYLIKAWRRSIAYFVLLATLSSLFVACGLSLPDTTNRATPPASAASPAATPTPAVVTQPVPPTQTDCPAQGTARPLVTAPLALGPHPQIVYVPADGDYTGNGPTYGSNHLVRYDTVTHISTDIVKLSADKVIGSPWLSQDRKWVFFTSFTKSPGLGYPDIQAVRVDGQGLQTLYCRISSRTLSWSPDYHWLAFNDYNQYPGAPDTIHLLDTTTGKILSAVDVPQQATVPYDDPGYFLWLSPTQLLLGSVSSQSTPSSIYLLDATKGEEHQSLSSLPIVTKQAYQRITTDGTSLFLGLQQCQNPTEPYCSSSPLVKSTIARQPVPSGTPQTIFESGRLAINDLRMLSAQTLLVSATNPSTHTCEIWTINTDGSNARKLVSEAIQTNVGWGTAGESSPDGTQFLALNWIADGANTPQTYYGSVQNPTLTPLPTSGKGAEISGWTLF